MCTENVIFLVIEVGEMFESECIVCGITSDCAIVEGDDANERSTCVTHELTSKEEVRLIARWFLAESNGVDEHVSSVWVWDGAL